MLSESTGKRSPETPYEELEVTKLLLNGILHIFHRCSETESDTDKLFRVMMMEYGVWVDCMIGLEYISHVQKYIPKDYRPYPPGDINCWMDSENDSVQDKNKPTNKKSSRD